jgi:hypothetical protein
MRRSILIVCLGGALSAHAAVPRTLTYQGYLLSGSGQPVSGPVEVTFKLYDAASGGSALWAETHASVLVSNGLFTVTLGSVTPLSLPFDQPYYLGITVGGGSEIAPRRPLTSAAYVFRSFQTSAFKPGAVTTSAIQNGTILLDRLANVCAAGTILVRSATGWQCTPLQ